jgi:hypothetical protein
MSDPLPANRHRFDCAIRTKAAPYVCDCGVDAMADRMRAILRLFKQRGCADFTMAEWAEVDALIGPNA